VTKFCHSFSTIVSKRLEKVDKSKYNRVPTTTYIYTYNALYPMVSFTVGLSHAQYMHVSQRAERERKSVNQVIQEIVEQEMSKENPK